jgi:hypothetical protein
MENAASSSDLVAHGFDFSQARGKSIFTHILDTLQHKGLNPMHLTQKPSAALEDEKLKSFISDGLSGDKGHS